MKIPIPKQYDQVMDWLAVHLLPPPKLTGLRLFGHNVTWLDLAMVAYPTVAALGLWVWSGNWLWVPMIAGGMVFAGVTFAVWK